MKQSSANKIILSQELTIFTVNSLKEEMVKLLAEKKDIVLDCSKVEAVDGAGIQLLLSLERTLLNQEAELKLKQINSDFEKALELLGVKEVISYTKKGD